MSEDDGDPYEEMLGEIYCLTFVRGVDGGEALRRMGGLPDTLGARSLDEMQAEMGSYDAGFPTIAQAMSLGEWTVVVEPDGFEGADAQLLAAVSRGTEAVSVLRHDYASDAFVYAVDGVVVTGFDPVMPDMRWGAEPDRLVPLMRAAGLNPEDGEPDEDDEIPGHAEAMRLAGQVTGILPDLSDDPLPSAHLEPWFSAAEPSAAHRPPQAEIADAIDAAAPAVRRAVAVREVRHLAGLLGVAHFPDVAEALDRAERGDNVRVPPDGDLGRRVRAWLAAARRASRSLNDHRHGMTDEATQEAFQLGWLAAALRGALWSDSPEATYEALRPLTKGPTWSADPSRRAAVLHALRDD